jgi:hypothetical protein
MECLNHFAPAIQAVAAIVIVLLTLVLVRLTGRYVQVSEALQKPCVTVKSEARLGDEVILDQPFTAQVAQTAGNVVLLNVGPGPALNLHFDFRQTNAQPGNPVTHLTGFIDYLQPGEQRQVHVARTSLPNRDFDFAATYNGLSTKKYQTTIRIEDGVIKSFTFK